MSIKKATLTINAAYGKTKPDCISYEVVRVAAYGQWERIHTALGARPVSTSPHKHTACVGCGGKDRFRVARDYQHYGSWLCSGGGNYQHGDGFGLLCHVHGWSNSQALQAVADYLGLSRASESERQAIRIKANQQRAELAAKAQARDASYHLLESARDALIAYEDLLVLRGRLQKATGNALEPNANEQHAAHTLIHAVQMASGVTA